MTTSPFLPVLAITPQSVANLMSISTFLIFLASLSALVAFAFGVIKRPRFLGFWFLMPFSLVVLLQSGLSLFAMRSVDSQAYSQYIFALYMFAYPVVSILAAVGGFILVRKFLQHTTEE